MKNPALTLTSILITISSCAVFDKYSNNKHTWYHASLSKVEKDSIKSNGLIVKKWEGRNSNGDFSIGKLYVVETKIKNHYTFIETGIWTEKHSASATKGWKALIKDSTTYDAMGNTLFKERFMDELNDNRGQYLIERWTSTLSDSLRQTVILYYPNGQIKYRGNFTTLEYTSLASDSDKKKKTTGIETFLENGQKCLPSELTYDQWYEPGTWMKK
jgi:hypothetical protein